MKRPSIRVVGIAAVLLAAGGATAAEPAREKPSLLASIRRMEGVEMLTAILAGEPIEPGHAWFHPAQSRYGWKWLAERMDADHDGAVTPEEFTGPRELFDRLDRDRDGRLTAEDFDWSDRSPYFRQFGLARQLLRRGDLDHDGKLSAEEWQALFKEAAKGRDKLSADDLRALLFPPQPRDMPSDEPSMATLLGGLIRGEIGSASEGPKLGEPAPDFTLKTADGGKEISLHGFRGDKPLVLMFGNFTCGPFRSQVPPMEELKSRYGDKVAFLGVYVREAHPTGGWRMESNDKSGIVVDQPQTDEERTKVASQCTTKLKMRIPLVVDGMDDRVGNAYSGMPARLYLIGRDGRVLYKSGRGPFGFRPPDLEQALIMHLLDQPSAEPRP